MFEKYQQNKIYGHCLEISSLLLWEIWNSLCHKLLEIIGKNFSIVVQWLHVSCLNDMRDQKAWQAKQQGLSSEFKVWASTSLRKNCIINPININLENSWYLWILFVK